MSKYKIVSGYGEYVIVSPVDTSTVLKTEETATVFRVERIREELNSAGMFWHTTTESGSFKRTGIILKSGDYVIVIPKSVEKTVMGDRLIYYVRESDIVGIVEPDDSSLTDS